MKTISGKRSLMLLVAIVVLSVAAGLIRELATKAPVRIGMTEQEWTAYAEAEHRSTLHRRLPPKKSVMTGQGLPGHYVLCTRYYLRSGHDFFTKSVGFEFTNGILVRIEAPCGKWHFDL